MKTKTLQNLFYSTAIGLTMAFNPFDKEAKGQTYQEKDSPVYYNEDYQQDLLSWESLISLDKVQNRSLEKALKQELDLLESTRTGQELLQSLQESDREWDKITIINDEYAAHGFGVYKKGKKAELNVTNYTVSLLAYKDGSQVIPFGLGADLVKNLACAYDLTQHDYNPRGETPDPDMLEKYNEIKEELLKTDLYSNYDDFEYTCTLIENNLMVQDIPASEFPMQYEAIASNEALQIEFYQNKDKTRERFKESLRNNPETATTYQKLESLENDINEFALQHKHVEKDYINRYLDELGLPKITGGLVFELPGKQASQKTMDNIILDYNRKGSSKNILKNDL